VENPEKKDEMVKISGGRQVPVIVEGGSVTVGYSGT
jgi:glutaredoxin